jgi:ATP-binding protein involved in chromosome partitioning
MIGANLAAALAATGRRVGITDTETLGAITPETLGAAAPNRRDGRLVPAERYGVQLMSFAFLLHEHERAQARPPSMDDLAARFQADVAWSDLDVLFIELPSSEDAARSLVERLGFDGVVIVATPQGAEEGATEAALAFYGNLGVPLLGLIENLSYYQCRQCSRRDAAQASGAVARVAQRLGVRFLGDVPISIALRDCMDENCPAAGSSPRLEEADLFERVALVLMAALDHSAKE